MMKGYAQDPSFAQFLNFRQYLNPALTGSERGLNVSMIYKNQWFYVPGGFNTYGIAADVQSSRLSSGIGIIAYRDVEAKAVQYLTKLDMDPAEKDELISKIPEIGLKILSASKKNNFIDRDNICFVAVMEGAVDFLEKMKGKSEHPELPLDDEESDEEPEEKIEDDEEE